MGWYGDYPFPHIIDADPFGPNNVGLPDGAVMSNNPYSVNWAALSVLPKEQVTCVECQHVYVSRSKVHSLDGEEILVAETPCPLCGEVELEQ